MSKQSAKRQAPSAKQALPLPLALRPYHLKAREAWIGWSVRQKKRRLPLAVNHSRFLILAGWHVPNLASRVMKLCLQRLSQDWTDPPCPGGSYDQLLHATA